MRDRISASLKEAMEGNNTLKIGALRLMLAAIRDREIALRTDEGESAKLSEGDIRQLLRRMVRQREDCITAYEEAGRMELAEQERREIDIIRAFLPKPMSEDEIESAVAAAVRDTSASSIRDIGRVMTTLKKRHDGRMDFGTANARVKAALG